MCSICSMETYIYIFVHTYIYIYKGCSRAQIAVQPALEPIGVSEMTPCSRFCAHTSTSIHGAYGQGHLIGTSRTQAEGIYLCSKAQHPVGAKTADQLNRWA